MTAPLAALSEETEFAPERAADYYPPTRTGLRGSHKGSFEVAHERAWNGKQWLSPTSVEERYDLIVVGGGISGLAAAYFYRAAHKGTRASSFSTTTMTSADTPSATSSITPASVISPSAAASSSNTRATAT